MIRETLKCSRCGQNDPMDGPRVRLRRRSVRRLPLGLSPMPSMPRVGRLGRHAGLLLPRMPERLQPAVQHARSGRMRRRCIEIRCLEDAVPGRSRCKAHGGKAWARQPPGRQAAYTSGEYQRNRKIAIAREPTCHWRLPGCARKSTTADHLIPVSRGGTNDLANLVGACARCNQLRGGAEGRATTKARAKRRRTT
jgi:5-methylcytosine-specific restriction endonuclease McrA